MRGRILPMQQLLPGKQRVGKKLKAKKLVRGYAPPTSDGESPEDSDGQRGGSAGRSPTECGITCATRDSRETHPPRITPKLRGGARGRPRTKHIMHCAAMH